MGRLVLEFRRQCDRIFRIQKHEVSTVSANYGVIIKYPVWEAEP